MNANDRYSIVIEPVTLKKVSVRDGVPRTEVASRIKGLEYDNMPIELVVQMEDLLQEAFSKVVALGKKYMDESLKKAK